MKIIPQVSNNIILELSNKRLIEVIDIDGQLILHEVNQAYNKISTILNEVRG